MVDIVTWVSFLLPLIHVLYNAKLWNLRDARTANSIQGFCLASACRRVIFVVVFSNIVVHRGTQPSPPHCLTLRAYSMP